MAKPRFSILVGTGRGAVRAGETAIAPAVRVEWRLSSGNGRELGRSAELYPDVETCRASFLALRDELPRANAIVSSGDGGGRWIWKLELDRVPVATGGRPYERRRECRYNLTRFLEAVREVVAPDGELGELNVRDLTVPAIVDLTDSVLTRERITREVAAPRKPGVLL